MRHMVLYRAYDGRQCYHETEDLESAVRAVEELRNTQNVSDLGIFSLQEVPIEFKPYYRVEIVAAEAHAFAAPDAAPWPDVSAVEVVAEPVEPAPVPEPVPFESPVQDTPAASTRFGLFSRG